MGAPVAILTDFGRDSFYVAAMKGVLSAVPGLNVIDITHDLPAHDIEGAGFILARVFDYFPADTVFLAVVDPGVGSSRRNVVIRARDRWLVCPDNGLATEPAGGDGAGTWDIAEAQLQRWRAAAPTGSTFLGRDVFAPAAAALASGAKIEDVGKAGKPFITIDVPPVTIDRGALSAPARFVDHFGNVLSAITPADIARAIGDEAVARVRVSVNGREFGPLRDYYSQQTSGTPMALLNSWGLVEVAVCEGSAAALLDCDDPADMTFRLTLE